MPKKADFKIMAVMQSEPKILRLIEYLTALCLMYPYLSLSSLQTPPYIPLLLKVASLRHPGQAPAPATSQPETETLQLQTN